MFIVEVKVAECLQQVGSAPTREAASLASAAVRRISMEGHEHTQVRIYLAIPVTTPGDAARAALARGSRGGEWGSADGCGSRGSRPNRDHSLRLCAVRMRMCAGSFRGCSARHASSSATDGSPGRFAGAAQHQPHKSRTHPSHFRLPR